MKKNKGNTSVNVELARSAYHNQANARQITDTSRLLESPEHKEKVALMRAMKWDQALTRTETLIGNERERSDIMKALDHNDVSKLEEIQEIAVTYGLKFLPAPAFKCPERYELHLSSLIVDFLREKKIEQNGYSKNSFYIMADEKYFLSRQMDIDDEVGVFVFYHPPKGENNYLRVEQIGSGELTFMRYLKGWKEKEPLNGIFHSSALTFFCSLPVFALLSISFFKAFILSCLLAAGAASWFIHKMRKKGGFNSHTWNKLPMDNE